MDLGIGGLGFATEIGAGASAIVYKARQLDLDREVAVKVLKVTDEAFIRRFRREAKTLGKLSQNPGIVTVYDTGVTAAGQPFLILELCESSVLDHLNSTGIFDPPTACQAAAQVAFAVADAHENGVVHRDLKPGNVLLSQTGRYMVTDFGISTVTGATMGQTNSVGFTAGYVAPETLTGEEVGPPSDVYALGATLFHMLAGRAPFVDPEQNSNLLALAQRVVNDPIPDLRLEGIPAEVCEVVEAAMAKKPEDRPTARELRDRLLAVGGVAAPVMTGAATVGMVDTSSLDAGMDPITVAVNEADLTQADVNGASSLDQTVGMAVPASNNVHTNGGLSGGAGTVGIGSPPQGPQSPFEGGILSNAPAGPVPLGPTPEERRYRYTTDDRRQLGPLLVGAVVGLIALLAVGGFLISRAGNDDAGDEGDTALEAVDGPSTSVDGAGNESTGQDGNGSRGTLNPDTTGSSTTDVATVEIQVPSVAGETATVAESRLASLGFVVNRVEDESTTVPIGDVIRQVPAGGTTADQGSVVSIYVSTREPVATVGVPDVATMSGADATAALTAAGLTVTVIRESDATVAKDDAIRSAPESGTTVNVGSDVTLFISDGPVVPTCEAIEGTAEATARSQLEAAGLTVTTSRVLNDTVSAGLVISCSQTPTTASLTVSNGSDPCPALVGTEHGAATAALEGRGFTVTETPTASATVPVGNVISCSVSGTTGTITWSNAVLPGTCPAVAGLTVAAATTALQGAGFSDIAQTTAPSATVASGNVISCAVSGSTATLTVSSGPANIAVPNIAGMTVPAGTAALTGAGLTRGTITRVNNALPAGQIISTAPGIGVAVAPGTAVNLTVSDGPVAQVAVPAVVGTARAAAVAAINAANLTPAVVTQVVPDGSPNIGMVISVDPAAGTLVNVASRVTITVGQADPGGNP